MYLDYGTFADSDALYAPRPRDGGGWGVWHKVDEQFVDDRELSREQAERVATRRNDDLHAAENATW